jgi:hypothetical protein
VRVGKVKKMRPNHGMLDIVLAGSPNRCEPLEMCKGSEGLFDWRGTMGVRRRASTSMYFM